MFWDFLYRLSPRDQAFPQLVYRYARGTDSGLKTPCSAILIDIPSDQIFIPTHWSVTATPAAATAIDKLDVYGLDPTGNFAIAIASYDLLTPGASVSTNRAGSREFLFIPGGWTVRVNASFTATTGNNQLSATVGGMLAPKGNLSSLV